MLILADPPSFPLVTHTGPDLGAELSPKLVLPETKQAVFHWYTSLRHNQRNITAITTAMQADVQARGQTWKGD